MKILKTIKEKFLGVLITVEQDEFLVDLSKKLKISKAEVVRQAIEEYKETYMFNFENTINSIVKNQVNIVEDRLKEMLTRNDAPLSKSNFVKSGYELERSDRILNNFDTETTFVLYKDSKMIDFVIIRFVVNIPNV